MLTRVHEKGHALLQGASGGAFVSVDAVGPHPQLSNNRNSKGCSGRQNSEIDPGERFMPKGVNIKPKQCPACGEGAVRMNPKHVLFFGVERCSTVDIEGWEIRKYVTPNR